MIDAGIVSMVTDKVGLQCGFSRADFSFRNAHLYLPQHLIDLSHFRGRKVDIGHQDELTMKALTHVYCFLVNSDAPIAPGKTSEV